MTQPKWLNNPRYQRAVQKMARLDPTRKAILDTIIADEAFADADMRNRLSMMKLASQKIRQQRNLDLNEERLLQQRQRADATYNLAENKMDFDKDQSVTAKNLGWVNLGVSGVQGLADYKNKKKEAERYGGLASLFQGS